MALRIIILACCILIIGCVEEQWSQREVNGTGVFISFPKNVIFRESSQSFRDDEYFYSTLTGTIDENTFYSIAISQFSEVSPNGTEKDLMEASEAFYASETCGQKIPKEIGVEMSFVEKRMTVIADKQAFLTKCSINGNGSGAVAEIYQIVNVNQLVILSIGYELYDSNIQSDKFLSSLEFAK